MIRRRPKRQEPSVRLEQFYDARVTTLGRRGFRYNEFLDGWELDGRTILWETVWTTSAQEWTHLMESYGTMYWIAVKPGCVRLDDEDCWYATMAPEAWLRFIERWYPVPVASYVMHNIRKVILGETEITDGVVWDMGTVERMVSDRWHYLHKVTGIGDKTIMVLDDLLAWEPSADALLASHSDVWDSYAQEVADAV